METYSPDTLYIRVVKYVEGEAYDFRSLDKLPCQVIAVNKKEDKVAKLEAIVAGLFDIPLDKLVILLRHEHLFNQTVRSEVYNMEWRREKTIDDASRLDHGTVLFVEEGNPKAKLEEY